MRRYDYTVDWGDEEISTNNRGGGGTNHFYEEPGVYKLIITGSFPQIFFNNQGDKDKI